MSCRRITSSRERHLRKLRTRTTPSYAVFTAKYLNAQNLRAHRWEHRVESWLPLKAELSNRLFQAFDPITPFLCQELCSDHRRPHFPSSVFPQGRESGRQNVARARPHFSLCFLTSTTVQAHSLSAGSAPLSSFSHSEPSRISSACWPQRQRSGAGWKQRGCERAGPIYLAQ